MNHILFVIDGVKYRQHGWLGCQLISYEWRRLRAGTHRDFNLSSILIYLVVYVCIFLLLAQEV